MVLRCAIHLEDSTTYYQAGGVVTGFIVLSTTWSDKLYGITVKLASKVEVDWDASRLFNPYKTSRNEDVAFHSDCQILMNRPQDGEQSCLANLVSKRTIIITRGVVHRYPFLLKLPKDLPCSFNGAFGYVSYKLVVFIRKPFREMYIGATKAIQIAPLLDLNDQGLHLQLPVQEERKYFLPLETQSQSAPSGGGGGGTTTSPSINSSGSGVVRMRIRLPKGAFVPSELIHFDVEIDNSSHLRLEGVRVRLNANTYFQMDESWKVDCRAVTRCRGPGLLPHRRETWSHAFPCPHVLPTGLGTGLCNAIDLQYFMHFELRISPGVQLSSVFKVVVGTVPFVHRSRSGSPYVNVLLGNFSSEDSLVGVGFPGNPEGDFLVPPSTSCSRMQLERRSSAPPSYDSNMLRTSPLLHCETPPPSYEEALSMTSLSRSLSGVKTKARSKSSSSSCTFRDTKTKTKSRTTENVGAATTNTNTNSTS